MFESRVARLGLEELLFLVAMGGLPMMEMEEPAAARWLSDDPSKWTLFDLLARTLGRQEGRRRSHCMHHSIWAVRDSKASRFRSQRVISFSALLPSLFLLSFSTFGSEVLRRSLITS